MKPIKTFNSLSRDHGITKCCSGLKARGPSENLSTPSLGITDPGGRGASRGPSSLSTPSLGITSRSDEGPHRLSPDFQLPLSGSRSTPVSFARAKRILSTPSLGITFAGLFSRISSRILPLSTPSLGITEPDSGIFRLSAAFCRGALSHK